MRILVTGGCGFIGSNFINYMFSKYPDIYIYNIDRMDYCANETNVLVTESNVERYKLIKGDICSQDLIRFTLEEFKIEIVVHFAAQSHVDNSFENSLSHTRDNVIGTHTLLEECRLYNKLEKFIHISTDEVYGESEHTDIDGKSETSILAPSNPYSASKAAAEMIVQAYLRSYKMPIVITRGNNVYGPNQYPEKLVPRFIKLLKEGKKCTIHGKGDSVRSFIHVDDTASAIDTIIQKGVVGEIYNIGSDEEYSVLQILEKLVKIIFNEDDYLKHAEFVSDRNFNDKRYFVNSEKLKFLGWERKINFECGIVGIF